MKIKTQIYDLLTTLLGAVISAIVMYNVDYGKLLAGDNTEKGKVIGAVVFALFSWLTNKTNEMKIQTVPVKGADVVVVKEQPANATVVKENNN